MSSDFFQVLTSCDLTIIYLAAVVVVVLQVWKGTNNPMLRIECFGRGLGDWKTRVQIGESDFGSTNDHFLDSLSNSSAAYYGGFHQWGYPYIIPIFMGFSHINELFWGIYGPLPRISRVDRSHFRRIFWTAVNSSASVVLAPWVENVKVVAAPGNRILGLSIAIHTPTKSPKSEWSQYLHPVMPGILALDHLPRCTVWAQQQHGPRMRILTGKSAWIWPRTSQN